MWLLPSSVHQVKMLDILDYKAVYSKMLMHNKSNLRSKKYWCEKLRLKEYAGETYLATNLMPNSYQEKYQISLGKSSMVLSQLKID